MLGDTVPGNAEHPKTHARSWLHHLPQIVTRLPQLLVLKQPVRKFCFPFPSRARYVNLLLVIGAGGDPHGARDRIRLQIRVAPAAGAMLFVCAGASKPEERSERQCRGGASNEVSQ
jgi:hypothetical protein